MVAPETLMGREERRGPAAPLWLERVLLALVVTGVVVAGPAVHDALGTGWAWGVAAYAGLALVLLGLSESLGRWLQGRIKAD